MDEAEVEITAISPNPFSDEFKIDFILKQKCQVEVSMISSKGEMIFTEAVMAEDGYNSFSYTDNKGLTSGYYFVIITYKDQKVTKKIMKMRAAKRNLNTKTKFTKTTEFSVLLFRGLL
ncbi:MAG: T9SS type A sorting domain-containing protein [Bacteroidetes bacterium]|nr:T9SS type A sorting domain-containing protein [Bacteroidota bacterium]